MKKTALPLLAVLFFCGCKKETVNAPEASSFSDMLNLPATVYDYPASDNDHVATLGRVLFYDKNMSYNNSVACASCHQQLSAFCDNQQNSAGLNGHKTSRNTPGIFNRGSSAFWDGRAGSFRQLSLMPVGNHFEMGIRDFAELANKLSKQPYYSTLAQKAFGRATLDSSIMSQAVAEFIGNFVFSNNKFKRSTLGQEKLTVSEQLGHDLFFGKAGCFNCHKVDKFGDNRDPYGGGSVAGSEFNIGLDLVYADEGVAGITKNAKDRGVFNIPSLFNVEYTFPYMHDGRYKTLEEVVEHYNSGVQDNECLSIFLRDISAYPGMQPLQVMAILDKNNNGMLDNGENATVPPKRLHLTDSEKRQLVDFLKTLSDTEIKTNVNYSNPFKN